MKIMVENIEKCCPLMTWVTIEILTVNKIIWYTERQEKKTNTILKAEVSIIIFKGVGPEDKNQTSRLNHGVHTWYRQQK